MKKSRAPAEKRPHTFDQRLNLMRREKEAIARYAARLVKPGMIVAIDSGTTPWLTALNIKKLSPLTVITNSIPVIRDLREGSNLNILCLGGQLRREQCDYFGPSTEDALLALRADVVILGADFFLPDRGVFVNCLEDSHVTAALAGTARTRIVVADHTKIRDGGAFLGLEAEAVTCLVTDSGVDPKTLSLLKKCPFKTVVAR